MTRRALGALLTALALAGCSTTPQATTTASTTARSTTNTEEATMTARLSVPGRELAVDLYDGPAARALATRLPLTTTARDYGGQEKIAPLPEPLPTAGEPTRSGASAGELGYYAPNQVLVLYYTDVAPYPGIVRLGRVTDADAAAALRAIPDGTQITLAG